MADPSQDCIFCRIANGELGTEFVAESEHAVAFRDLSPQAPTHVLVVPRRHYGGLRDIYAADPSLGGHLLALAAKVAASEGLFASGYRVLTNDGSDAGQTVHHLHFHVLGGKRLREGLA
ncbi:MAG: histidine triad nucleotide-binding protein [Thermomicrobiales bacterium]